MQKHKQIHEENVNQIQRLKHKPTKIFFILLSLIPLHKLKNNAN